MQDCGQCGIRLCYVDAPLVHGEIDKNMINLKEMEKKFNILNIICWVLVILSIVSFFVLLVVCKYKQIHTNNYSSDFFVNGFFSLTLILSIGLLLGFPKTIYDIIKSKKNVITKKQKIFFFYRFINILIAFVGNILLLVFCLIKIM